MNMTEMTGLEIMQAIVAGHLPKPPMAETMAINFEHVESGYLTSSPASRRGDSYC